jgi:NADH-quinone oxidoreductase subunit L
MGGLRKFMPLTFATYAIGMMSLAGVPLLFCGFWSKDEILHSAWSWAPGKVPFLLAITGAFLTAFYMTRQMVYVFFGPSRLAAAASGPVAVVAAAGHDESAHDAHAPSNTPHESPPVMTLPLAVLAACVVLLSVFATPVFPWFHSFLSGHAVQVEPRVEVGALLTMLLSTVIVGTGLGLGWRIYGRRPIESPDQPDPLESLPAGWYDVLRRKFLVDELYELSLGRFNEWCARASRRMDDRVWSSVVSGVSTLVVVLSWLNRLVDEYVVNLGFDRGCGGVRIVAWLISFWQNGQVQRYLRFLALGVAVGALCFLWGCNP